MEFQFKEPIHMTRATHYGNNYWLFHSRKVDRRVTAFSNLEYENLISLEMDPNVVFYCEQPCEQTVMLDGKKHKTIFDVYVVFLDGTEVFQEVKYAEELTSENGERSRNQINVQQYWCKRNNYNYELRTDKDIELKQYKATLKSIGQDQIVGRFMINEFQFFGMLEPQELMLCLLAFDRMTTQTEWGGSDEPLLDFYFPDHMDRHFSSLADEYWTAFLHVMAKYNIKAKDIPMKYMIDSFILLLQRYGRFSAAHIAFPTAKELIECVEASGYGESDEEYIANCKGRKLA